MMYRTLAFYYDELMAHVDYDAWVDYVLARLQLPPVIRGHVAPCIVDLACGTGTISVLLAQRGYRVVAVDVSEAMLAVAAQKAEMAGVNISFIHHDMTEDFTTLGLAQPADAVVCLCDSLNYLTEDGALGKALKNAAAILKPKAPFLFDLHTESRLREYGETIFAADEEGVAYIWQSDYDEVSRLCTMYVTLFASYDEQAKPPLFSRYDEIHRERAFTDDEVEKALKEAGLHLEARYGELTTQPPRKDEGRIFYLTRRLVTDKQHSIRTGEM